MEIGESCKSGLVSLENPLVNISPEYLASICPCFRPFAQLSVTSISCVKEPQDLTKSVNSPPAPDIFRVPQVPISIRSLETETPYIIPNHIHFISPTSTIILYPASPQNLFNVSPTLIHSAQSVRLSEYPFCGLPFLFMPLGFRRP